MVLRLILVLLLGATILRAQPSWQEEFAKMPLAERAPELDRRNCARILLNSFQRNSAVRGLVFMPGATDELYFFRRARARLTNSAPSLLDAITAITNQTYIRADVVPPFLVLHTAEDPLQPSVVVEDQHTADRIQRAKFERHVVYNDRDWNFVAPILAFDINTRLKPPVHSYASNHFFRHSFAAYDLSGMDALRAVSMAGKTRVTIKRKVVLFQLDERFLAIPPNLTGDSLKDSDR